MTTLTEIKQKYLSEALARPIEPYCFRNHKGEITIRSNFPIIHAFTNPLDITYAEEHFQIKEIYDGKIFFLAEESPAGLYQSADGKFYTEAELPEQSDEFCSERYADEVRNERNLRISDTDEYVQLADITVETSEGAKRRALTESEREALSAYRQALRDLTEQDGFPFVPWPEFPEALAYELQRKLDLRTSQREGQND